MNNKKMMKKAKKMLININKMQDYFRNLSEDELRAFQKTLIQEHQETGMTDSFIETAYAYGREVTYRVLGKFHYDVQVIGALVMHFGAVAELVTGAGKTLTEILPAYLNTFGGRKVHIITVNDYLAQRDSEEMGEVFSFLGLKTGRIWTNMPDDIRRQAYQADIIYGINSEFGFDYLKDNMVMDKSQRLQTGLDFCIIDEADSVLIDEAKTPLIISSETFNQKEHYLFANAIAKKMRRGTDIVDVSKMERIDMAEAEEQINKNCHYRVDPKNQTVLLTNHGIRRIEKSYRLKSSLSSPENALVYHFMVQALKANATMELNKNYIVQNGEIVIIDEFTGRKMEGRRFSDGLHQALEAKEAVEIKAENDTIATITFQNFFRLYGKVAGMSGTVAGEHKELLATYGTPVVVVPTHKPVIRIDEHIAVFATEQEKFEAVISRTEELVSQGRPVLIGTSSIAKSTILSKLFTKKGLHHSVLNAKQVERESYIIAQAGRSGAITIATNMAGRGTDIRLGGNPEYIVREKLLREGYTSQEVYHAAAVANLELDDKDVHPNVRVLAERWKNMLSHEEKLCAIDHEVVLKKGGLFVIGTELADSSRVDNQLRGRAGRQGDPGGSKFYVSLEDDMMKVVQINQRQALQDIIKKKNREDAGDNVVKRVVGIQRSIESQSYEQRKDLLKFDEVDNLQRKAVYALRNDILDGVSKDSVYDAYVEKGIHDFAEEKWNETYSSLSEKKLSQDQLVEETVYAYQNLLKKYVPSTKEFVDEVGKVAHKNLSRIKEYAVDTFYDLIIDELNEGNFYETLPHKEFFLKAIDKNWKQYIVAMQNMKDSVKMTYMSQVKPIEKYKQESSKSFDIFKKCVGMDIAEFLVLKVRQKNN